MKYHGYWISRGAYQGTCDDRLDRWYIDEIGADHLDRRGAGYRTTRDAKDEIDREIDRWHQFENWARETFSDYRGDGAG
jgi:hypothetical protein